MVLFDSAGLAFWFWLFVKGLRSAEVPPIDNYILHFRRDQHPRRFWLVMLVYISQVWFWASLLLKDWGK